MYPLHFWIGYLDSDNSGNLILNGNNWLDPNALMLFLSKKNTWIPVIPAQYLKKHLKSWLPTPFFEETLEIRVHLLF